MADEPQRMTREQVVEMWGESGARTIEQKFGPFDGSRAFSVLKIEPNGPTSLKIRVTVSPDRLTLPPAPAAAASHMISTTTETTIQVTGTYGIAPTPKTLQQAQDSYQQRVASGEYDRPRNFIVSPQTAERARCLLAGEPVPPEVRPAVQQRGRRSKRRGRR